ncbi:uncharacterized protein PHACADRAFT_262326 [Phanerochaete carnosa HHB-10118-sp]|uniref:Uncharacterized protein n=1 Tax=Phanerochaete carnosa (strain HHB-10118-sp) TaxID=650164 RepID=K5VZ86_PHACS|nr:uncharacterized protein PHACADRAFT_262326 [Phanerochaete carnosa HHB-10118-sp]EKM51914.1 hypothetical protein PHACADRAFT_262326 [Phanerochaete carnosa HHB-10118-sp]
MLMSLDSQALVDDAIAAHDREIARLVEEKRLLRTRRNTLAPINQHLPPEMLSEVFLSLFRLHRDSWGAAVRLPLPHNWLTATFVCQHWRNIALRTPSLWTHIILTRSDNKPERILRLHEWVKRSGRLPLTIEQLELVLNLDLISYTFGPSIMSLIMQVASRIQRLAMTFGGPIITHAVHEGRTLDSPSLESIAVVQTPKLAPNSYKILREYLWPAIRSLRCMQTSPSLLQALIRNTLTTLYVKECTPPPTIGEWLLILGSLPSLAHLTLIRSVSQDNVTSKTGMEVGLPALRHLWIRDREGGISSAQLLSCIAIPNNVRAHIAGDEPVQEAGARAILAQVAAKAAGEGIIGEPWNARVCVADYSHGPGDQHHITLILYTMNRPLRPDADKDMSDQNTGFSVTLALGRNTSMREPITRAFYSLISLSEVEGLMFRGSIKKAETFSSLLQPQMVRQVEAYTQCYTATRLLRLLQTGTAVNDTLSFPYPELHRLTLTIVSRRNYAHSGSHHAQTFVRLLADTLEERAKHGLRTRHLTLTYCVQINMTACEEDFARLRGLVKDFHILQSVHDTGEEYTDEEDDSDEEGYRA